MSWQELSLVLLGGVLLVCFGLLLGATWTTQALQPSLRQQARERRKLNEEWSAARIARKQLGECPRCGCPLIVRSRYFAPTPVDVPPDED